MKAQAVQAEALTRPVSGQALTDAVALCLRARRLLFAEFGLACLGQHSAGYDWIDRIERRIWEQLEDGTTEKRASRRPWTTTVFHVSQTEPNNGNGGK
jgi:hypothetical protein